MHRTRRCAIEWINSHVHFDQPALEATLADYMEEVDPVAARFVKLGKPSTKRCTPVAIAQRGGITKTGNGHLRRVLVEAACEYQHKPNVIGFLLRRQESLAISDEAKDIAWKAQQRLHKRYKAMAARQEQKPDRDGNRTRIAGFHLGHCGRNGKAAPARKSRLREAFFDQLDSSADDSARDHEKENPSHLLCGTVSEPNPRTSPRQLPTDHDHAVPTREY
jgi:hypothetical protein